MKVNLYKVFISLDSHLELLMVYHYGPSEEKVKEEVRFWAYKSFLNTKPRIARSELVQKDVEFYDWDLMNENDRDIEEFMKNHALVV